MGATNNTGHGGVATIKDFNCENNAITFIIKQLLSRNNTALLCTVVAVTGGGVAQAPFVDLQPLVNQIDSNGQLVPCGVLHNVPCYRLQNGNTAVISDPQRNDVGVALFSDRDISALKASYNQNTPNGLPANVLQNGIPPNTTRRFSVSDGLYFGGFYNAEPTNYIQMTQNAININVTGDVNVTATGNAVLKAASVKLQNAGAALKALVNDAWFAFFDNHVHTSAAPGVVTSIPTVLSTPTKSSMETSVTKAE